MQGHLASVTSAAEQVFILGLSNDGWLGGADLAVEGEWRWADGPDAGVLFWIGAFNGTATGFASWNGGEPNNSGNEDVLHLNGGRWNDSSGADSLGYFIEYSVIPTATVPTPGSLGLVALALAALSLLHVRRPLHTRSTA